MIKTEIKRPMLAGRAEVHRLTYPVLVSAKLDGVRALVQGGELLSRSMKLIPNRYVQSLFGRDEFEGLDGELIVGLPNAPDAFRATGSGLMSHEGEPDVHFYVFDDFGEPHGFELRHKLLKQRISKLRQYHLGARLTLLPHVVVKNEEELRFFEEECLKQGYEGVMIRSMSGPYKEGRSTSAEGWLLKLKRFEDGEAVVLGMEPLMRNHNPAKKNEVGATQRSSHKAGKVADELLGTLLVRDAMTGVEFGIGTGFTEAQRVELWRRREELVGAVVRYKYFPTGSKDAPRFPVFQGFRAGWDL